MIPKLDNVDRLGFLKCMQWAGAVVVWSFARGVPSSQPLGAPTDNTKAADFTFIQISDSHLGFNKPANSDVNGTLHVAVDQINAAIRQPDLILHTGDLTHLAKAAEFDTLDQILKGFVKRKCSMSPANTTSPVTTANYISNASASPPPAKPGKASTTRACISSVSTTASSWKGSARSARSNWNGSATAFPQPAPGSAPAAGNSR
jgi:hypothetical protein